MDRPKNFLFLVVLFTVVAIALVAFYATRPPRPTPATGSALETSRRALPANPASSDTLLTQSPSNAAQKRAKDFNDAANRFNAPDNP